MGLFTKCTIHLRLTDPSVSNVKESLRALIASLALFVGSSPPGGSKLVLATVPPGGGLVEGPSEGEDGGGGGAGVEVGVDIKVQIDESGSEGRAQFSPTTGSHLFASTYHLRDRGYQDRPPTDLYSC